MCSIQRFNGRPCGTCEFETIADRKSQFNKVTYSTMIQHPLIIWPISSETRFAKISLARKNSLAGTNLLKDRVVR